MDSSLSVHWYNLAFSLVSAEPWTLPWASWVSALPACQINVLFQLISCSFAYLQLSLSPLLLVTDLGLFFDYASAWPQPATICYQPLACLMTTLLMGAGRVREGKSVGESFEGVCFNAMVIYKRHWCSVVYVYFNNAFLVLQSLKSKTEMHGLMVKKSEMFVLWCISQGSLDLVRGWAPASTEKWAQTVINCLYACLNFV